jgi:hypothetical protein
MRQFTQERMTMDLQTIKEYLWTAYTKLSQFLLFLHLVLYGIACITVGQPIGIARYVAFLFRVFTFK